MTKAERNMFRKTIQFRKSIPVLRGQSGLVLPIIIMLTALLAVMGSAAMFTTRTNMKISGNYKSGVQAFYAADAGAEYGLSNLRQLLDSKLTPNASDLLFAPPTLEGYEFDTFTVEKEGSILVAPITTGNFAGLSAYRQEYKITSEARVAGTNSRARVVVHAEDFLIPLFQFGVFYENDLEILPGPAMTFSGGRIHSNSDIYLGANNSLSIDALTSSAGDMFKRRKNDGSVMPGKVQIMDGSGSYQEMTIDSDSPIWESESQSLWDGRVKSKVHGIEKINLPLPEVNKPIDIIKSCQDSDSDQLREAKFCWKAGIRIIEGVAYDRDGNTLNLAAGGNNPLSTESLWDAREGANIEVTSIDIEKLKSNTVAMNALNNPPPGEDAGILYVSNSGANNGARLVNGASLPTGGLMVASENPMYIQGDYNLDDKPAGVAGDAVSILSNSWSDSKSSQSLDKRVPSNTTVRAAIMGGHVETVGGQYSGGLENFPRFLEKWSGKTFTYSGSLVSLWFSEQATGNWQYGSPVYTAPNRNWSYGMDLSNLPPGTPRVRLVQRVSWSEGFN